MAAVGSYIREMKISHPTVGDKVFFAHANESATLDEGTIITEANQDGVTGNGSAIRAKKVQRWKIEGTFSINMDFDEDEIQYLKRLNASNIDGTFTITLGNGAVYSGSGFMVGNHQYDIQAGTASLSFEGGGELRKTTFNEF